MRTWGAVVTSTLFLCSCRTMRPCNIVTGDSDRIVDRTFIVPSLKLAAALPPDLEGHVLTQDLNHALGVKSKHAVGYFAVLPAMGGVASTPIEPAMVKKYVIAKLERILGVPEEQIAQLMLKGCASTRFVGHDAIGYSFASAELVAEVVFQDAPQVDGQYEIIKLYVKGDDQSRALLTSWQDSFVECDDSRSSYKASRLKCH